MCNFEKPEPSAEKKLDEFVNQNCGEGKKLTHELAKKLKKLLKEIEKT